MCSTRRIPYNECVNTRNYSFFLFFIPLALIAVHAGASPDSILRHGLFTIEYPEGQRGLAEHTLAILEAATAEFAPMLPAGDQPVRVKIIEASEEFRRFAAHYAELDISGLARPGEGLIVVKAPRLRMPGADYPGTLRHELTHLLLHRNVNPAYLPKWLDEGIAMSLANEYRWQSMFSVARMFVQNRIIPYGRIDQAFFTPTGQEQFNDAYAQALSMTRHLRNMIGDEKFWRMVRGLDSAPFHEALPQAAGITLAQFWDDYERSLWKYALIAAMGSGFFFQPAAILLILAYLRRRRIAQGLYQRWEEEEAEETITGAKALYWEEIVEDPDAWKNGFDDEDDEFI